MTQRMYKRWWYTYHPEKYENEIYRKTRYVYENTNLRLTFRRQSEITCYNQLKVVLSYKQLAEEQ